MQRLKRPASCQLAGTRMDEPIEERRLYGRFKSLDLRILTSTVAAPRDSLLVAELSKLEGFREEACVLYRFFVEVHNKGARRRESFHHLLHHKSNCLAGELGTQIWVWDSLIQLPRVILERSWILTWRSSHEHFLLQDEAAVSGRFTTYSKLVFPQ